MAAPTPMPPSPSPRVMRTPRTVDLELTARCNLRCRYCYFFGNEAVPYTDLPTEEWVRFMGELGRAGVMSAALGGGEPFIREDLPEIIGALVENHMRFDMVSNGGLITDALAGMVAASGRCDEVQISIDGSRPETHDSARGAGSFDGAVRGIRFLKKHGVRVTTRITLHQGNADDLAATVRMLVEDLGVGTVGTNAAGYLGSCRQRGEDLLLFPPYGSR